MRGLKLRVTGGFLHRNFVFSFLLISTVFLTLAGSALAGEKSSSGKKLFNLWKIGWESRADAQVVTNTGCDADFRFAIQEDLLALLDADANWNEQFIIDEEGFGTDQFDGDVFTSSDIRRGLTMFVDRTYYLLMSELCRLAGPQLTKTSLWGGVTFYPLRKQENPDEFVSDCDSVYYNHHSGKLAVVLSPSWNSWPYSGSHLAFDATEIASEVLKKTKKFSLGKMAHHFYRDLKDPPEPKVAPALKGSLVPGPAKAAGEELFHVWNTGRRALADARSAAHSWCWPDLRFGLKPDMISGANSIGEDWDEGYFEHDQGFENQDLLGKDRYETHQIWQGMSLFAHRTYHALMMEVCAHDHHNPWPGVRGLVETVDVLPSREMGRDRYTYKKKTRTLTLWLSRDHNTRPYSGSSLQFEAKALAQKIRDKYDGKKIANK